MAVAPDRPLHHAHLGDENPFELIDSPWGHIERWRASTLSTGTMGALSSVYDAVRADAVAAASRADEAEARDALVQHLCDKITDFEKRFDALEDRLAAAEDARRADEQAAREFEEEPLTEPPDIHEFQNIHPASSIAADETHHPSGDLHTVDPKEEDDNIGDLPPGLEDPPDPVPEPKGSVYPQPVAISLNKE